MSSIPGGWVVPESGRERPRPVATMPRGSSRETTPRLRWALVTHPVAGGPPACTLGMGHTERALRGTLHADLEDSTPWHEPEIPGDAKWFEQPADGAPPSNSEPGEMTGARRREKDPLRPRKIPRRSGTHPQNERRHDTHLMHHAKATTTGATEATRAGLATDPRFAQPRSSDDRQHGSQFHLAVRDQLQRRHQAGVGARTPPGPDVTGNPGCVTPEHARASWHCRRAATKGAGRTTEDGSRSLSQDQ